MGQCSCDLSFTNNAKALDFTKEFVIELHEWKNVISKVGEKSTYRVRLNN